MRTLVVAAALAAGLATVEADAQQRMVTPGPGPGPAVAPGAGAPGQPSPARPVATAHPRHWGGRYQGHWVGGLRAPGGWAAYRRPAPGVVLTTYWTQSSFAIGNWSDYGLSRPPVGYHWSRYYDDAVLVDGRGAVLDTVAGIDWPRYDLDEAQGGAVDTYLANRNSYEGGAGAPYAYPPDYGAPPPPAPVPAPRAYADARPPHGYHQPPREETLPPSAYARRDGAPPPLVASRGFAPPIVVQDGGSAIVSTTTAGGVSGGTYVNGYYPSAGVTTLTVATTPVVTTTTEVFEDDVTYVRPTYRAPVVRKVYRKRVYRPAPTCYCR